MNRRELKKSRQKIDNKRRIMLNSEVVSIGVAKYRGLDVNWIEIDEERCKGCYLCIAACVKKNIVASECLNAGGCYPAVFRPDNECSACALCARVCPDAAIEVFRDTDAVQKAKP
jgi:2-oxoglutarate ferredoxin oxidoreductase subunit delta